MTERQPLTASSRYLLLRKSVSDTRQLAGVLAVLAGSLGAFALFACLNGEVGGWALLLVTLTGIVYLGMLAVLVTAAVTGFLLDLAIVQHEQHS